MNQQELVREFMETFGQGIPKKMGIPSESDCKLGTKLIQEELGELESAYLSKDFTAACDAVGDLLYVVLWNANKLGVDISPIFSEIHRSNMSKAWTREDLKLILDTQLEKYRNCQINTLDYPKSDRVFVVLNEHGKVVKSPSYSRADLTKWTT